LTDDTLSVDLNDGRTISVPLEWFSRLVHATVEERNNWRLIGKGHGIHWEDIDEDINVKDSHTSQIVPVDDAKVTDEICRDARNRPRIPRHIMINFIS